MGNLYFWLQLLLFWRMRGLPQPGAPWIGPLRLGLCGLCTILMVASILAGAESGQFFPQVGLRLQRPGPVLSPHRIIG